MGLQKIPHDFQKFRGNPIELLDISNRNRIGSEYPITESTKLLITGIGENNSTNIVDSTGKTITRNGDTKISTAQSIIGGSSIYFDGTGDYLSLADSADWAFGSGDFTVDFWVKSNTGCAVGYGSSTSATSAWKIYISSIVTAYIFYAGSSMVMLTSTSGVNATGLTHVAFVRYGSSVYLYVNGVQEDTDTAQTPNSVSIDLKLGYDSVTSYLNGYLSHIRITKGQALWTSNFTPPRYLSHNYIGA